MVSCLEHFNVIGKTSVVETKGRLHKLKWVWHGQCRCMSEQSGIVGNSRHCAGQNGAAKKKTVQDYYTKAGQRGLFTPEPLSQLGYQFEDSNLDLKLENSYQFYELSIKEE